jgi:crotonobetaine/carnitine-CoA ligase
MTETSSFTTQNLTDKVGSVGKPLPWFDVRIVGADGHPVGPHERGEIHVRENVPGLITKGYVDDPEATAALLHDGWLHTGDVGYTDDEGDYYFAGRLKDSIRRRGENITALEIERIVDTHPAVAESAAIAVPNEIADEDVKIFLRLKPGASLDPGDFIEWALAHMARFQVPRYVAFIDAFPKTPSERIRKDALSRETRDLYDREAAVVTRA